MTYPQTDTTKAYFDLLSMDYRGIIRMVWPDFKNTLISLYEMTPKEFVNTYIQYLHEVDENEYNNTKRRFLFKKENIYNEKEKEVFEKIIKSSINCSCSYKTNKNYIYIFAYHLHGYTWH